MTEVKTEKSNTNVENKKLIKLSGGSTFTMKTINLDTRCEINDKLFQSGETPNFSLWVWLLKTATTLNDDQINELSTEEIVEASTKIVEGVNKKK